MGDSLQVKPGDTSVYTVSLNYGTCSAIDTVQVNVIPSRNFNDMQALSFATSNTIPVRGPISIQANFKNLGKPAKNFIVVNAEIQIIIFNETVSIRLTSIYHDHNSQIKPVLINLHTKELEIRDKILEAEKNVEDAINGKKFSGVVAYDEAGRRAELSNTKDKTTFKSIAEMNAILKANLIEPGKKGKIH
jgi:hypothetical protein